MKNKQHTPKKVVEEPKKTVTEIKVKQNLVLLRNNTNQKYSIPYKEKGKEVVLIIPSRGCKQVEMTEKLREILQPYLLSNTLIIQ